MSSKSKKFFGVTLLLFASWTVYLAIKELTISSNDSPKDFQQTVTTEVETVQQFPTTLSPNPLVATKQLLLKNFDAYLSDPENFAKLVAKECSDFPEGDLFPYIFPAMAYTNLALAGTIDRQHARKKIAALIQMILPAVRRRLKPPENKLKNLESYSKHATYLGQLNLVLGCYQLVGGDKRFEKIQRRVSDIFYQALLETDGKPLESYPTYSWTFDTIPVLLSLKLDDLHSGTKRSQLLVKKHLAWIEKHAVHKPTGLPFSQVGETQQLPRGCDLSLRLCLLSQVDRSKSETLYENYKKHFWLERGIAAGFAEWPEGEDHFEDYDSGPIIMGIGTAASGLGLGTVIAMNDQQRLQRLVSQMAMRDTIFSVLKNNTGGNQTLGGMIPFNPKYFTGFLFGDAVLFYAITWQNWFQ
ncbi:MAG: hypothetical protein AAF518_06500 [Spirochaetota bacterium]